MPNPIVFPVPNMMGFVLDVLDDSLSACVGGRFTDLSSSTLRNGFVYIDVALNIIRNTIC